MTHGQSARNQRAGHRSEVNPVQAWHHKLIARVPNRVRVSLLGSADGRPPVASRLAGEQKEYSEAICSYRSTCLRDFLNCAVIRPDVC
jgi:hypothetical protein